MKKKAKRLILKKGAGRDVWPPGYCRFLEMHPCDPALVRDEWLQYFEPYNEPAEKESEVSDDAS